MSGRRVLVCGGREFTDYRLLCAVLDGYEIAEICHGGATGADTFAGEYANVNDIPCRVFPADWAKHGRAAGPIRNVQMLTEFDPDLVAALPGGRGTAHMVKIARAAAVEVRDVADDLPVPLGNPRSQP